MRFRLTYCNRSGNIARLDIITNGDATTTQPIEGTESPFILTYNNDKPNKSGYFRSSSADINIYETPAFNIDTLKTSNETDIKVEWYIDDVLTWSGFVIPDFFSRQIGVPATVNMTASDRLGTLKGVTLSGLSETVTLRSLATQCLQNTGLSLPLNTYAAFTSVDADENIFDSKVYSQRLNDNKGRSISCYDVLESILVLTNSILIQRFGEWYIYNKIQLESGVGLPEITFDEVSRGAIRSIQPVASSVGVYNEFGGGRIYPPNYSFEDGLDNWTAINGFAVSTDNKHIIGFLKDGAGVYRPYYDLVTSGRYFVNENEYDETKYLRSDSVQIPFKKQAEVEVNVDINYMIPDMPAFTAPNTPTFFYYAIIVNKGADYFSVNDAGTLQPFASGIYKFKPTGAVLVIPSNAVLNAKRTFKISDDDLSDYQISLRIYGGESRAVTIVNSFSFDFNFDVEIPKGNIFKTEQGSNFTKQHDINTTIFGDFITGGLNGYFYDYPIEDTSILRDSTLEFTRRWTTPTDSDQLPILQHVSRQKSRLFSIAHDILRAELDIVTFDPLIIFKDCSGKKYTLVKGSSNFLTGEASVEIEEIRQDATILKRDYIYSNFGDTDSGVKSVGGISSGSGGGGSGGGMTFEQLAILNNLADWWKLDDDGNLYSEKNVYSEKEVSAYGFSGSGTPIDGVVNLVDLWDVKPITGLTAGDILKYNGTKWVNTPESSGGGVSSWNDLTDKPSTFAPSAHTHAAGDVTSGIFAIGRIPTGSTSTTVALGNHLHTGVYKPNSYVPAWSEITGKPAGFDTLKLAADLDFVTTSGIYRQENPSSGFSYTTTLNLNSDDGRQQLTIARDGAGMKFRGVESGSGGAGWSTWKTVWHSGNIADLKSLVLHNPNITGTATVQTDIVLSGLLSTNKSLKALLDKFDIDSNGDVYVKTNFYSTGEITAYK